MLHVYRRTERFSDALRRGVTAPNAEYSMASEHKWISSTQTAAEGGTTDTQRTSVRDLPARCAHTPP
jgi:hypothetical protein